MSSFMYTLDYISIKGENLLLPDVVECVVVGVVGVVVAGVVLVAT